MKKIIKQLYNALPLKKQVFSILRAFNPPQKIYQHLYFKGPFKVNIGQGFKINHYGFQLENDLFWGGLKNWESVSLKLWIELSKSAHTILDVGANTGIYSLVAGAVNPNARIYAFEPLKGVHKRLEENLRLNKLPIKAYDLAASNNNGMTSFYTDDSDFSYGSSLNKNHQFGSNKIEQEVETITLDRFVEQNNIIPVLIKIDVERHEPEVIEGLYNTLRKFWPTLLIEVLDDSIGNKLKNLLDDTPYQYYSINEKNNTIKRMREMGKSDDYNVLICTEDVAKKLELH